MPIIKVEQPIRLTQLQLRRLFTFEEKVALEQVVKDGNLLVKVLLDDLAAAEFIDLTDSLVTQGLSLLVSQELLTQARADQIMNNEMPDV